MFVKNETRFCDLNPWILIGSQRNTSKKTCLCSTPWNGLTLTHHPQEQLIAELLANPVPSPPAAPEGSEGSAVAVPPHVVDGVEIKISDLMVGDGTPLKDQHLNE